MRWVAVVLFLSACTTPERCYVVDGDGLVIGVLEGPCPAEEYEMPVHRLEV